MFWGRPLARERCDTMDGTGPERATLNCKYKHLNGKPPVRTGPRNRPQIAKTIPKLRQTPAKAPERRMEGQFARNEKNDLN